MRVASLLCVAALLLTASLSSASVVASTRVGQSPWKIIESWTKQMPGGNALQILPAYSSLPGLYFTTSQNGTIYAVNSSTHSVQWSTNYDDIAFVEALPEALSAVVIGRSGSTTVVDATTGAEIWTNTSIVILNDLTNHGDRNFVMFGQAMVYRETSLGFTRICVLDIVTGSRVWCDNTYRSIALPDMASPTTFTAPIFDSNGQQYVASYNVVDGSMNWLYDVQAPLTANSQYVAVVNDTVLWAINATTGNVVSSMELNADFPTKGTAVMIHTDVLAMCDGSSWVAAYNMKSGELMWNVSTYFNGLMQLQRRGDGILVLAVLDSKSTNFTRFNSYQGNMMWTLVARATGTSLAPVHGWLGNDIIYIREVTNSWAAYGVDTGDLISQGSGDLFLPRSSCPDYLEPHVGYFVTGPEGIVYKLKIVPRKP